MKDQRLSIDIQPDIHKKIKVYCANHGISMREFITNAISIQIDLYENGSWVRIPMKEGGK